ncbi:fused MFS/spermidine synthase [Bradyrhizobium sp. ISRA443]|uniref:fused MFS/spermidine synthase n=1 Tax=unclassified Bradyrhizobium TaxID=2631580 RepID=UPI00247833E2|nr:MULTISPECIES: fused MFS/spermidine synthase [unclassified Bradyrhizobium]WGR95861.1 fused MFS/spermidine synthase [Bradyrhizobium sp. ISRA435]WGS00995.1 fused MFS/spermidine synthase [Bradyrhizobium sp. ISRA436]WGS07882.1 fused MFS/spermidine synthase [Bradyrhizobium sp. ISRA437]WGS14770.1 fused MFS/spermidine synthase [Bradyrhizobium sp. ISRA443]
MTSEPSASRNRLVLVVYTAAIFVSALLLFSVQPLFTKMVLPRLGGSPAVWSVAMVFFQSLLLGGYAYAHVLMKLSNRAVPVAVHLALLVVALLTLPLAIRSGWGEPPNSGYAFWLLGLFAVSIGLPFFALAANNPLLQAWFVRTGHPNGPDPYFLYASSNIGSFLALLSYPVLLEPMFTLRTQNLIWTGGYGLLIVLIAGCGALLLRAPANAAARNMQVDDVAATEPSWLLRARWILLAAVPSGLLIAVTAHISTDVAAAPLLWVLPLSLYLLTWVLVFQSRPLLPHKWMLLAQPMAISGVVVLLAFGGEQNLLLTLGGHQLCFFVIAMACHGELARTRPAAKYLTGFYVALSFGGMVGGLFAGLIAPFTFSWVAEYPILLALAALCRPSGAERLPRWSAWYWPFLAVLAVALIAPSYSTGELFDRLDERRVWMIGGVGVLSALLAFAVNASRWKIFATVVVALVLLRDYPSDDGRVDTVRSFFGVHKIVVTPNGQYHVLMHGTTIHGAQRFKNDNGMPVTGRPEPISYYHRDGGIGQAITAMRERKGAPLKVAVIGLGSGTLTCASAPGEDWKFFEIDQSMVDTARDPRYFTYIQNCEPDLKPVIGDARLTFAKEPDGVYDLIIVDAYSSDAIPIHLATEQAMAIYKAKLAPHGAVVMHVSNRHLELASVVVGIADANDMKSWVYGEDSGRDNEYIFATSVVVSARDEADIGKLASSSVWTETPANENQRIWTDDYSNVLGAVYRRLRDSEQ